MESKDKHSAINRNAHLSIFIYNIKNYERYNGYGKISDDYPCI